MSDTLRTLQQLESGDTPISNLLKTLFGRSTIAVKKRDLIETSQGASEPVLSNVDQIESDANSDVDNVQEETNKAIGQFTNLDAVSSGGADVPGLVQSGTGDATGLLGLRGLISDTLST